MAKTPINNEQMFVYQFGKDVAELQLNVSELKKSAALPVLRIKIPAKPGKYDLYSPSKNIELPAEFANAICLKKSVKHDDSRGEIILTSNTLYTIIKNEEQDLILIKISSLSDIQEKAKETINVDYSAEFAVIDKDIEQRERQEREQRERQEREQRNKEAYKTNFAYWALVDYAMTKYAQDLSNYARLEFDGGEELRANKNGLERFLAHPFVKVKDNNALDDNNQDYLSNTPAIIADLKAKLPEYQAMQDSYVAGTLSFDDMPKVSYPANYNFDEL